MYIFHSINSIQVTCPPNTLPPPIPSLPTSRSQSPPALKIQRNKMTWTVSQLFDLSARGTMFLSLFWCCLYISVRQPHICFCPVSHHHVQHHSRCPPLPNLCSVSAGRIIHFNQISRQIHLHRGTSWYTCGETLLENSGTRLTSTQSVVKASLPSKVWGNYRH